MYNSGMSNINYTMEYLWNYEGEREDPMMEAILQAQRIQQRMIRQVFRIENGRLVQVELDDESDSESVESDNNVVQSYERHFIDYKTKIPEHKECMISMEEIEPGEMYHVCIGCKKTCSNESMMQWWNTCKDKGKKPTCPMCRKEWNDTSIYQYY